MNTTLTTLTILAPSWPGTLLATYACGHQVLYPYNLAMPAANRACPSPDHGDTDAAVPA